MLWLLFGYFLVVVIGGDGGSGCGFVAAGPAASVAELLLLFRCCRYGDAVAGPVAAFAVFVADAVFFGESDFRPGFDYM